MVYKYIPKSLKYDSQNALKMLLNGTPGPPPDPYSEKSRFSPFSCLIWEPLWSPMGSLAPPKIRKKLTK